MTRAHGFSGDAAVAEFDGTPVYGVPIDIREDIWLGLTGQRPADRPTVDIYYVPDDSCALATAGSHFVPG